MNQKTFQQNLTMLYEQALAESNLSLALKALEILGKSKGYLGAVKGEETDFFLGKIGQRGASKIHHLLGERTCQLSQFVVNLKDKFERGIQFLNILPI